MGAFIVQSDVEDLIGSDNLLQFSNLSNGAATVDTNRVAAAIGWAEATVRRRMRSLYGPSWTATGDGLIVVKDICARLAAFWLANSRGRNDNAGDGANEENSSAGQYRDYYKQAMTALGRIACGLDDLGIAKPFDAMTEVRPARTTSDLKRPGDLKYNGPQGVVNGPEIPM